MTKNQTIRNYPFFVLALVLSFAISCSHKTNDQGSNEEPGVEVAEENPPSTENNTNDEAPSDEDTLIIPGVGVERTELKILNPEHIEALPESFLQFIHKAEVFKSAAYNPGDETEKDFEVFEAYFSKFPYFSAETNNTLVILLANITQRLRDTKGTVYINDLKFELENREILKAQDLISLVQDTLVHVLFLELTEEVEKLSYPLSTEEHFKKYFSRLSKRHQLVYSTLKAKQLKYMLLQNIFPSDAATAHLTGKRDINNYASSVIGIYSVSRVPEDYQNITTIQEAARMYDLLNIVDFPDKVEEQDESFRRCYFVAAVIDFIKKPVEEIPPI